MNQVQLYGRLGRDPEVYTGNKDGNNYIITRFSMATNRKLYDNNGNPIIDPATNKQKEETTWHRIKTSGKLAKACADHLYKGREVIVIGRIHTTQYETQAVDVKTGKPVSYGDGTPVMVKMMGTEIVARRVQFIGKKNQENAYNNNQQQAAPAQAAVAATGQAYNANVYPQANVAQGADSLETPVQGRPTLFPGDIPGAGDDEYVDFGY